MPDSPFPPVPAQPDLPAQELAILDQWRERRTFARLREQLAGGPRWSFLDGPITANAPMGVHHAWGRTYKDVYQRFHAMLGEDQRFQNGFDCQGLWVEVNVERELGFTSKRDIEHFGLAEFVTLCKQRVLTFASQQTEQSIRLGMWMDWNDPHELRRLRDLLAEDPSRRVTVEGPDGPVSDTAEMIVGRLGMPDLGGSYFTFSDENNYLIWGFLAEVHRRGWLYKGHDAMPWCARCGTGLSQMEMNEGYQDKQDPGLTVKLPLVDRPGESLLVWTTTPWTIPSNVAAAVGEKLRYVRVRQGDEQLWVGRGTLRHALEGPFEVLEERPGSELIGWEYEGPFDDLAAVERAFERGAVLANREQATEPYRHRVIAWDAVGEEEGTGIVHIAPGCGAEDFQLGKALGLPVIAPLDENGTLTEGFGSLSGRDVRDVADPIVHRLRETGHFYRLETIMHRYPHCWRCGTPLVFRLVDEWYIDMGPVYDKPRGAVTPEEVDRSLRYQIMEQVDRIRWLPAFGHERELDWLLNMHDWMISKKRYWGLALPIYDCAACGTFDVLASREELRERAVDGWAAFEGHTPHRPHVDAVTIACRGCGAPVSRIPDVGNPWLDAGIVPFSTLHYREDPGYWADWFPADFVTESFPGQFRNWFYSLLAMSTVLRREPPFRTILGYATLFAEDGRAMHKSWGNAIEFNEAADRMGVDVMRWMFARQKPEDNILFGYHAADESRRELLVLWNVFVFFVTYARLAGWRPQVPRGSRAVHGASVMDRWIASRTAALAAAARTDLEAYDLRAATGRMAAFVDELSTWYLRRSRRRLSRSEDPADRDAAFATLHATLVAFSRMAAPVMPFLAEHLYGVLVGSMEGEDASVHLSGWPSDDLAPARDEPLEQAMSLVLRAVDLARTLRSQNGLRTRQPLATVWLAVPGGRLAPSLPSGDRDELLALLRDELNVRRVELIGDESQLVQRRVKPLLPKIGRRLGPRIPAVMAAARADEVEYLPDGGVRLGGVELAPHEVEIVATPRPGTAVAADDGVVVIIDTVVTDALRAEGDARELTRAVQDLRKQAELPLDQRIAVWVTGPHAALDAVWAHVGTLAADTLADAVHRGSAPDGIPAVEVPLSGGPASIALSPVAAASLAPVIVDGPEGVR